MFLLIFVCSHGEGAGFPECITGHAVGGGGGSLNLRGLNPRYTWDAPNMRVVRILLESILYMYESSCYIIAITDAHRKQEGISVERQPPAC